MSERETRLHSLGFQLAQASPPAANYVPLVLHGDLAYLSGALPTQAPNGLLFRGRVGTEVTLPQAQEAARLCAVNLLRVFCARFGSLDSIARVVRLGVYVSAVPDFTDAHLVANGASDLLVDVLGDSGRHARSAICVAGLPLNATVELDAIFAVAVS